MKRPFAPRAWPRLLLQNPVVSSRAKIAAWITGGVILLTGALVYGLALWKIPNLMRLQGSQSRYDARLLVISVGGSVVVIAGLLYTARNYRLTRRGQITDRFTKALEQLGSDQLYVRIGGVHALEHVMRDSADYHVDVMEVLCVFIDERCPRREHSSFVNARLPYATPDVQAALNAICRRPARPERGRIISLDGLNLARMWLASADLRYASFCEADLTDACLCLATLAYADLEGADLTKADLMGANLNRASLTNANLTETNFTGADLTQADLTGADLTGADFAGADLLLDGGRSWRGPPDLTDAKLGPNPPLIPDGWVIVDEATGRVRREDPKPPGP